MAFTSAGDGLTAAASCRAAGRALIRSARWKSVGMASLRPTTVDRASAVQAFSNASLAASSPTTHHDDDAGDGEEEEVVVVVRVNRKRADACMWNSLE